MFAIFDSFLSLHRIGSCCIFFKIYHFPGTSVLRVS
jgi:hypothetical protein